MQVKIKKHASRVQEAIDLCKLMVRGHDFENAKYRLLDKYRFEIFDVSHMMDNRKCIEEDFKLEFARQTDILAHYFTHYSNSFYLCDLLMGLPYLQSEKRKCRYVNDQELNCSQAFAKVFYDLDLIDETYNQNVVNFEQLSLLLENIDIDKEDKWLIQRTYLHLEEEMKQFVLLINQIVEWLTKYEEVICKEEELFYNYWIEVSKMTSMPDYLSKKLNIDITKGANTIWIIPAFFNCQGIHSKVNKDTINVYMGMIFDQNFSFEMKYENPSLICNQLKLLSDASKFEILCTIKQRPYYGSELAKKFNLSTPTISHHMRSLENAGFIKIEKKDNKTYYSLDYERLSLFLRQVDMMLLSMEEK